MNDWSKDFIEHLRTVHFTLATICVTIAIIASSTKSFNYYKAQGEVAKLREIGEETVAKTLQTLWSNRFKPEPKDLVAEKSDEQDQHPSSKDLGTDFEKLKTCRSQPNCRLIADGLVLRVGPIKVLITMAKDELFRDPDTNEVFWKKYHLKTPDGIAQLWKALRQGIGVKRVATLTPLSASIDGTLEAPEWLVTPETTRSELAWRLILESPNINHTTIRLSATLNGKQVELTFDSVFTAEIIRFDDFATANPSYFQVDTLEKQFPAATRFMAIRTLENNNFDEIMKEVATARDKADNPVTVFGIVVPSEQLASWGLVLLLGVQLYFWIHLCEITGSIQNDSPGWKVAWVAIYPGWHAKMVTKLSVSVGPVSATLITDVLVIAQRPDTISHLEATVLILGAWASIWIAALTYRQMDCLQKKRPPLLEHPGAESPSVVPVTGSVA